MSRTRIRALVLCAGFGSRLQPLTFAVPKPLLMIAGVPVVGWTLKSLAAAGCEAAALNVHHRPRDLPRTLGLSHHGLPLEYSHEEEIQGTYGALFPLRDFLRRAEAVVMINGDSLCRWPVRQAVRHHLGKGADATLLLLRRAPDEALGGGIGVDAEGRVAQMRDQDAVPGRSIVRRHAFAGLHVLSPRLLERIEERPGDIITDLYQPLLREGGHLTTLVTRRPWHDLGTAQRYHAAALDWARPRGLGRLSKWKNHLSALAEIDPSARVVRSQIERGAEVASGARVESSLVLTGARIGAGCRIRHSIVGPDVLLPPASEVEQRMICRYDKRHDLQSHESQIGDLVYTPL